MPQCTVTANKLNKRSFIPRQLPEPLGIVGVVNKDFTFEGEEVAASDIPNSSLGTWYMDGNNNFYWGGGVNANGSNTQMNIALTSVQIPYNYNQQIQNISEEWKNANGDGVIVAILDTGCYAHPFLKDAIALQYNVFDKSSNLADDNSGHGTFVAGLIASNNNGQIEGVSPKAKLIVVKVANNGFDVTEDNVYDGLNWLLTKCPLTPDIINVSLDFPVINNAQKFADAFKAFSDKKVITLAAAQDDEGLLQSINYPAKDDNVIAIGALNAESTVITNGNSNKINAKVKYLLPNIVYNSLDTILSNITTDQGSSFATAITSGVFSSALAYSRKRNIRTPLIDFIDNSLEVFNANIFTNNLNIYKL